MATTNESKGLDVIHKPTEKQMFELLLLCCEESSSWATVFVIQASPNSSHTSLEFLVNASYRAYVNRSLLIGRVERRDVCGRVVVVIRMSVSVKIDLITHF